MEFTVLKIITIILAFTLVLMAPQAYSRDTKHMMSIQEALASPNFKAKLDPSISLYFGDQTHPKVERTIGTYPTNKKTNAFNKTDEEACQWVFLSTLIALTERAKKEGGDAVINIVSYYKKDTFSSNTEFECHAGSFVSGVALSGEVVKLAK